MWIVVALAVGALATDGEITEVATVKTVHDSNALFEVTGRVERETITTGERKDLYTEWAHLRIVRKSDGEAWEGPFENDVGIDAVVLVGEGQFVTISKLPMNMGHRIARWQIADTLEASEVEEVRCSRPSLAPNRKWVLYTHWYPRMGLKEERHTSAWMVDITQPEFKPVLVYPPDNATGAEADGRIHDALVRGGNFLWSADCGKLYYFDRLSEEQSWKGAVVSLVEIQIGEEMTIEKTSAFPVEVEDFAKPGADLTKLAFYPEKLHWAGDRVIGGRLSQEPGWKSQMMRISIEGAYLDPDCAEQ